MTLSLTTAELHRIAVHESLALMGEAFGRTPDASTADTWAAGLPFRAEAITAAARTWMTTETRHPSLAAFRSVCETEAHQQAADARQRARGHEPGPDPAGMARCGRGWAVIRAQLAAEATDPEAVMEALAEADVLGHGPSDMDAPTVACPACQDEGVIWRDDNSVAPCVRCEPDLRNRWEDHWRYGWRHRCEGCR